MMSANATQAPPVSPQLMNSARGLWLCFVLVLGSCHPQALRSGASDFNGEYALRVLAARSVPYFLPGLVQGEGTTIQEVVIHLEPSGRLTSRLVVAFTDSGTVTDTLTPSGSWRRTRDSVFLEYQWTHTRFSPLVRGDTLGGRLEARGFTLPRFAFIRSKANEDLELQFERF